MGCVKYVKLDDLVDIERPKKGKEYQDVVVIQVSASKGQSLYIKESKEIDSKYVVLQKKRELNMEYLQNVIELCIGPFLKVYQTGLNINPNVFKFFAIPIVDIETQNEIVNLMKQLDEEIESANSELEALKKIKEYHLDKMFPN